MRHPGGPRREFGKTVPCSTPVYCWLVHRNDRHFSSIDSAPDRDSLAAKQEYGADRRDKPPDLTRRRPPQRSKQSRCETCVSNQLANCTILPEGTSSLLDKTCSSQYFSYTPLERDYALLLTKKDAGLSDRRFGASDGSSAVIVISGSQDKVRSVSDIVPRQAAISRLECAYATAVAYEQ